ncbi:MAG: tRNA lysidine(34) synthetase TilS [Clostridia bacterium]|nr:tRNA lysidine(34) synthetase TilS [Clostridia bacterium]
MSMIPTPPTVDQTVKPALTRALHLPRTFTEELYACGLPYADAHIAVAFSGGADSTALLHMVYTYANMQRKPFAVSAVHIHHGIRGVEADRDAAFCRTFCEEYGIPYSEYRCDVPRLAALSGRSLEEEAREQRYALLAQHIDAHPEITHLLTAHHADDQAETVLFRMLRGTSAAGIAGIARKRDFPTAKRIIPLIRPLLHMTKQELLSYCAQHNLSYVTDSTNETPDASRNLLRVVMLPAAQKINPAFTDALLHLSKDAEEDEDYFKTQTNAFFSAYQTEAEGIPLLPLTILKTLHKALSGRILTRLYRETAEITVPCSRKHIYAMTEILSASKAASIRLPSGFSFFIEPDYDRCYIAKNALLHTAANEMTVILLPPDTPVTIWNQNVCFYDSKTPESEKKLRDLKNIYKFFISTHINSDKLLGSVFVRTRNRHHQHTDNDVDLCTDAQPCSGNPCFDANRSFDSWLKKINDAPDVYLCGGSRKSVRDALSSHKVPLSERAEIPLFCDEEGIFWIPFCGIRDSVNPRFMCEEHVPHKEKIHDVYYFYSKERT